MNDFYNDGVCELVLLFWGNIEYYVCQMFGFGFFGNIIEVKGF